MLFCEYFLNYFGGALRVKLLTAVERHYTMFDIFEVNEFLDARKVFSVENVNGPSEEFCRGV